MNQINKPEIDMAATGKNIKRLREEEDKSVTELQDIFGFATPQAIYKWQNGKAMPTIDNLVVLAAVLFSVETGGCAQKLSEFPLLLDASEGGGIQTQGHQPIVRQGCGLQE